MCIWSLQHMIQDDLCHQAAFAITIENVDMRLWFCCHSLVIVSEPFNLYVCVGSLYIYNIFMKFG